jgi:formate hydrogenlyase subunit 3/multisubunit Na+/H+ antiporter MnhD subunit
MLLPTFQNFMSEVGLSLVAGVPLLLAAGCCARSLRDWSFRLLPLAALPALLALLLAPRGLEIQVEWFFMGGTMGIDAIGRIFLGVTACVWLFAALAAVEKLRDDPHRHRFAGYFLASMGGNFGLILARDILDFYLFFALMSFSAYGLIIHNRTAVAARAGRVYLVLVFLSELAMFTALVLLSARGEVPLAGAIPATDLSPLLIILLFIAFGVKVGALPFQSWMALSYQQAPVPGATALAGAMVNAGILGWLRFFPFGHVVLPGGGVFFIVMGAAAALYGVFFGLYQDRAGRVLASSSISQMGLVTLIAGYGLLSEDAGMSAPILMTLFAVHHSLAKTSLFLGYDLVDRGGRPADAILAAGLLAPCLSLAGLPLTSGAMLKGALKEIAHLGPDAWYVFGTIFLPLSSVGTTILMLHCIRLLRLRSRTGRNGKTTVIAWLWVLSAAGVVMVPWMWQPLRDLAGHSLQAGAVLQSLWPVALGAILALFWFGAGGRLPGKGRWAADFDDLVRWAHVRFLHVLTLLTDFLERMRGKIVRDLLQQHGLRKFILSRGPARLERLLGRWPVVFLFYLLLCILLFMMMLTAEYQKPEARGQNPERVCSFADGLKNPSPGRWPPSPRGKG